MNERDVPSADAFALRTGLAAGDEALLSRLPLFKGLEPALLRALLADSAVRRVPRHTILFVQGDAADRFYVVMEGWVKLFRTTPDGHETVTNAFTRGESFAEAASFAEGVFPVSAEVVEDARLLVVPAESFTGWLRRNPELALTCWRACRDICEASCSRWSSARSNPPSSG